MITSFIEMLVKKLWSHDRIYNSNHVIKFVEEVMQVNFDIIIFISE